MATWSNRLVVLSLLLGVSIYCLTATAAEPTKDEIVKAIKDLGDRSFPVRQKASAFLRKAGEPAEQYLQDALKDPDIERKRRAREILEEFKWGIYPSTPKEIVELVNQYRSGNASSRPNTFTALLKKTPRCVVIRKLIQAEETPDVKKGLYQTVVQELPRMASEHVNDAKPDLIEEWLELGLLSEEESVLRHYAAFVLQDGNLDKKITHWKAQADKDKTNASSLVLAYLYRAKGDLAKAKEAAEKAGKAPIVEAIQMEQGAWKDLAARPAKPETNGETLGFTAAFNRLAGNTKGYDEAVAALQKVALDEKTGSKGGWMEAKALFLIDRPGDALDVMEKRKNYYPIFEVLAAQMRYDKAIEAIGKGTVPPADGDEFRSSLRHAQILYNLGEQEKGVALLTKLWGDLKDYSNENAHNIILTEMALNLKDSAIEHCTTALEKAKGDDKPSNYLSLVFPKDGAAAGEWWAYLRRKNAGEATKVTMQKVRDIFEGHKADKDFAAWVQDFEKSLPANPPTARSQGMAALAAACKAVGNDALAQTYLERAVTGAEHPENELIRLGDFLAGKKMWKEAAQRYEEAWEKDRTKPLGLYLKGLCLIEQGQKEEGKKLMERAHWVPLGNDQTRHAFATELAQRGQPEDARRERELLLKVGPFEGWYSTDILRQVAYDAAQKQDFPLAADLFNRFVLRCLRSNVSFREKGAYVHVPFLVHTYRAKALLAAGKKDEAKQEIKQALEAMPGNVNLPIQLIPDLEKQQMKKEADEMFQSMFDLHQKVCTAYPKSAWAHNSLAWLSARCRRELDKGLEHATKTVALAPKNAGYLDTLAEIQFQRGEKDKAIETIKQCIELDPKTPYFRDQLKRFEKGDPKAPVPDPGM